MTNIVNQALTAKLTELENQRDQAAHQFTLTLDVVRMIKEAGLEPNIDLLGELTKDAKFLLMWNKRLAEFGWTQA